MRNVILGCAMLSLLAACGGEKIRSNHHANIFPRAEFIAYVPTLGNDSAAADRKLKALIAKHCGVSGPEAEARLLTYGPFSWQRQWGMPAACNKGLAG